MDSTMRRLIPTLSTLGLAAAAGCGGDTTSDSGGLLGMRSGGVGTPMGDVPSVVCQKLQACDSATFAEDFSSTAECEAYLQAYLDYFAEISPACASAVEAYASCFAQHAQCVSYTEDATTYRGLDASGACAAEEAANEAACDVGDYTDYYYE